MPHCTFVLTSSPVGTSAQNLRGVNENLEPLFLCMVGKTSASSSPQNDRLPRTCPIHSFSVTLFSGQNLPPGLSPQTHPKACPVDEQLPAASLDLPFLLMGSVAGRGSWVEYPCLLHFLGGLSALSFPSAHAGPLWFWASSIFNTILPLTPSMELPDHVALILQAP